jgi:long-chain acyl-CoA synthetase
MKPGEVLPSSSSSLDRFPRWTDKSLTTKKAEKTIGEETLGRMFWSRIERSESLPAQMVKREGRWHTLTWAEVGEIVRELALGLLALGRKPGDMVALLSQNRPEWVQADFAILSTGSVTVPIYPSCPPDQIAYIVNDSEARILIVEDPGQLAKALDVRGKMDSLEQIVVIQGYEGQEPSVLTWDDLRLFGREQARRLKRILADRVVATRPEDTATIVYTSGTTGPPKGVVQTHGNHIAALHASAESTPVEPGDVHLLFLPLAHSFSRLESFIGVHRGLTTAFAETLDKVSQNLREVHPHFICGVPRIFEKVYAKVLADVEAGPPVKQKIFSWALKIGREVTRHEQDRQPIPGGLKLKRRIAHTLVFSKLHDALGGRLRFAASGGAPLSRAIAEFFHAAGIRLLEGYGLTEACPVLTFNRIDHFKLGSVGQAIPGVELRIAADGEILARGPNIATRGYFKKPEATAEAFKPEGWFHTGDIGRIDEGGFLFITDRKKDLIVTAGGMNIAPQNIENLLKDDRFLSHAIVCGDRRPYPVALITLNSEELAKFAKKQGILFADYAELTTHPKVVERVGRIIEEKNAQLASYARIKKFAVLPADFTQDGGELTPTLKLKRKVGVEKYKDVLESLYR